MKLVPILFLLLVPTLVLSDPLVSVIVRVYERAHLLGETLESIQKQSYKNLEIIIVDDGSTDPNVRKILKERADKDHRIKLHLLEKNGGGPAALNAALTLVTGDYIAIHDSDDISHKDKFKL